MSFWPASQRLGTLVIPSTDISALERLSSQQGRHVLVCLAQSRLRVLTAVRQGPRRDLPPCKSNTPAGYDIPTVVSGSACQKVCRGRLPNRQCKSNPGRDSPQDDFQEQDHIVNAVKRTHLVGVEVRTAIWSVAEALCDRIFFHLSWEMRNCSRSFRASRACNLRPPSYHGNIPYCSLTHAPVRAKLRHLGTLTSELSPGGEY